jgi:hypothetical protein
MTAFGMKLQRDYASRTEVYTNATENCQSTVSLTRFGEAWVCRVEFRGQMLALGNGATADAAASKCAVDARRNHAALAELLERQK